MNKFLNILLALSFSLAGCSVINEPEAPAPIVKVEAKPAACKFPTEFAQKSDVLAGVDCLQLNLDNAFDSLQGDKRNEISISELKKLQQEGLLTFAISNVNQWNGIGGLLSLIHPEGRNAISRAEIQRFLHWLRTKADFLAKLANIDKYRGHNAPLQPELVQEMAHVAGELITFFSDSGSLSMDQALSLVAFAQENIASLGKTDQSKMIHAGWTLKALFLETTRPDDAIRGSSLKTFVRMGIEIAARADKTYRWWDTGFHPDNTPADIESEWQAVLEIAKQYFRNVATYDIDPDNMRSQVRVMRPTSDLADRIPDLVKASRKLVAKSGDPRTGLLYGLLHLFNGADKVAQNVRAAAFLYSGCKDVGDCSMPLRDAIKADEIKAVAMVSSQDWNFAPYHNGKPYPKRLDGKLAWKTVFGRFIERGVVANIFSAFDHNQDQMIPYVGETPEDISEATNVAYNILGILSARNVEENAVPFYVKPEILVGTVGLVGDSWVVPGNKDGKIDVNEFYAALKVYTDINFIARSSSLSLPVYTKEGLAIPYSDTFYVDRPSFIKNIGTVYAKELPYLIPVFEDLNKNNGGAKALTEVIVPKKTRPIDVFDSETGRRVRMTDYLERADMFRPVSILVLLDRMIAKCDTNEDEHFNWSELDCVAPLTMSAGKQIFQADLFKMPMFVSDGATLTLDKLSKKGLPIALAKVILLNGSLREMKISDAEVRQAKERIKASNKDLASLFAELDDYEELAMREKISVGVSLANSYISGGWRYYVWGGDAQSTATVKGVSAWDSIIDSLMKEGVFSKAVEKSDGVLSQDGLEAIWEKLGDPKDPIYGNVAALKQLVPLAFVVGSRPNDWKLLFNEKLDDKDKTKVAPISPSKVLSLLESILAPALEETQK